MVVPMKNQFEQYYNSNILSNMGIKILTDLKIKRIESVKKWIFNGKTVKMNYEYNYNSIIQKTLSDFKK